MWELFRTEENTLAMMMLAPGPLVTSTWLSPTLLRVIQAPSTGLLLAKLSLGTLTLLTRLLGLELRQGELASSKRAAKFYCLPRFEVVK